MVDTLGIEIICWIFFAFTISITAKANKDKNDILKYIFGVISILLAIIGLIGLFVDLSPFLTANSPINSS